MTTSNSLLVPQNPQQQTAAQGMQMGDMIPAPGGGNANLNNALQGSSNVQFPNSTLGNLASYAYGQAAPGLAAGDVNLQTLAQQEQLVPQLYGQQAGQLQSQASTELGQQALSANELQLQQQGLTAQQQLQQQQFGLAGQQYGLQTQGINTQQQLLGQQSQEAAQGYGLTQQGLAAQGQYLGQQGQFLQQQSGLTQQGLALQGGYLGQQEQLAGQQYGVTQASEQTQAQQAATNYQQQQQGLTSSAVGSGALNSAGYTYNQGQLQKQYGYSLQELQQQAQQAALGYQGQQAGFQYQGGQLGLQQQQAGLSTQEQQASLGYQGQQLGLSGQQAALGYQGQQAQEAASSQQLTQAQQAADLGYEGTTQSYQANQADITRQQSTLDDVAKSNGLSSKEVSTQLKYALNQLGLSSTLSVGQLVDEIASANAGQVTTLSQAIGPLSMLSGVNLLAQVPGKLSGSAGASQP